MELNYFSVYAEFIGRMAAYGIFLFGFFLIFVPRLGYTEELPQGFCAPNPGRKGCHLDFSANVAESQKRCIFCLETPENCRKPPHQLPQCVCYESLSQPPIDKKSCR